MVTAAIPGEARVKYLVDLFKPLLTLLITLIGLAFIASVLSPRANALIEEWIPLWIVMEPAEQQVRDWLGLSTESEAGWWHFWSRD